MVVTLRKRKPKPGNKKKAAQVSKTTAKNVGKVNPKLPLKTLSKVSRTSNRIKLTKKVLAKIVKAPVEPKKQYWRKSWEGNSDDEGSVDSGILEENICFACGLDITDESDPLKLIVCDECGAEYHTTCLKLEREIRHKYVCCLCRQEEAHFSKMKFNPCGNFEVPKRSSVKSTYCYSPSRPLEQAWPECQSKGFMVVSKILSYEVMKKLTHGVIDKTTVSGRVAETWHGAIAEIDKRLLDNCQNLVNRGGRFDLQLPDFVVQELRLAETMDPIVSRLRTIMGTPQPVIRTHSIVFVPVGTPPQAWHIDDSTLSCKGRHRYFTILIHLNPIDSQCGGTEVWSPKMKRADLIRPRPGDGFVFNGSVQHRGHANNGNMHRFFYYCTFSCRADANMVLFDD